MKKKKAVLFSGGYFSHIKPIKCLIESLRLLNYEIYVFGNPKYRNLYKKDGCRFFVIPESKNERLDNEVSHIISKLPQSKNFDEYLFLNNEQSLLSMHNFSNDVFNYLCNIIGNEIKPDVIFKDAIDIYADGVANKLHIPIIGYITNHLYGESFFNKNPQLLYSIFSRSLGYKDYLKDTKFIDDYVRYLNDVNDYVEKKYGLYHRDVFQQFDPNEKVNLIFASKYLQPSLSSTNQNIVWLPKNILETDSVDVDSSISELYQDNKKIVYISNGSFINIGPKIFEKLIMFLENYNVNIVIASGTNTRILSDFVKEYMIKNKVIVSDFVPQRSLLKHCSLFITHGGYNSLLEGTVCKVPMLVLPISPEQRLNGFIWDMKRISYTDYKINKKSTGEVIDRILTDKYSLKNLKKYSELLKFELKNEQSLSSILENIGL